MTLSMLTIEGTWQDVSGAPLARAVTMTATVQTPADHVISDEALNRILGLSRTCQTDPDGMARVQVVKAPGAVYRVVFGGVEGHLRCDDWDDDATVPFVAIKDVPGGDPLTPTGVAGGGLTGTYPNPTVAAVRGVTVSATAPTAGQVLTASSGTAAAWTTPPLVELDTLIDGAVEDYLTAHPLTAHDADVSALIGNPATDTRQALDTYERARMSVQPPTLQRVTSTPASGPRFIDKIGALLYGVDGSTGAISTSPDGVTWTQVNATWPAGATSKWIARLIPTADGEMIAMTGYDLRKSSGWSTDPATATWSANKVTPNGTGVFNGFGLDGNGQKFILAEYSPTPASWSDSRYAYISTDAGETWTVKYDTVTLHGAPAAAESHLHAACYDPWTDRFYLAEGHGSAGGVYTSTDDGATWTGPMNVESNSSLASNGPTVIVATDDGLVMGSDNNENGVFGVLRKANPTDERIIWNWRMHTGRDGLVTFAQRGWRDPDTGLVYVTFRAEYSDTPLTIAAGTAGGAGKVYELPTLPVNGGSDRFYSVAKIGADRLFAYGEVLGLPYHFTGTLTKSGPVPALRDTGYVDGGKAAVPTSLAVGRSTATAGNATAAGQGASASAPAATAIGYKADAFSGEGTAIGNLAKANNAGTAVGSGANAGNLAATAIGYYAEVLTPNGTAIGSRAKAGAEGASLGREAEANGGQAVAVGFMAVASQAGTALGKSATAFYQGIAIGSTAANTGNGATAIGWGATATLESVAIGKGANAAGASQSIAIGAGTTANSNDQLAIGARHIEAGIRPSDPANPPANAYRLFAVKNGAGKVELKVRFPSGAAIILATEA